jgi:hypothetical protein
VGRTFEKEIKEMDPREAYSMCLSIEGSHHIQQMTEKRKLKKEYFRRSRLVFDTELNKTNTILATGSWAVPVLRYRFGIVN